MKFKVGDKVRLVRLGVPYGHSENWMFSPDKIGKTYFIIEFEPYFFEGGAYILGEHMGDYQGMCLETDIELFEEAPKTATEAQALRNGINTMHTWWDEAENMPSFWSTSMTEELVKIYLSHQPKKGIMQKLSELSYEIRKAFSKDEKALYQAGYIDQHGKWTSTALNIADKELSKKYLDDNKADFVERALEEIAMSKEENDCCE